MTMLAMTIIGAKPSAQTAAPGITFRLRIEDLSGAHVHALVLQCQARIEPRGRRYSRDEQARLYELFGPVSQWDHTLRGVTWSHQSLVVPSFDRQIEVDLRLGCTYDLEVASAKYLSAVRDGDVPLVFLFTGTIFRVGPQGLSIEPVSWDVDAAFRLPASVWRAAMDQFFPGGGWIRLERGTIDRLQAFRGRHAVVTFDEALELLLRSAEEEDTQRLRPGRGADMQIRGGA